MLNRNKFWLVKIRNNLQLTVNNLQLTVVKIY